MFIRPGAGKPEQFAGLDGPLDETIPPSTDHARIEVSGILDVFAMQKAFTQQTEV